MRLLFSVIMKYGRFGFSSLIVGLSGELIFKSGSSGFWRRHLHFLIFLATSTLSNYLFFTHIIPIVHEEDLYYLSSKIHIFIVFIFTYYRDNAFYFTDLVFTEIYLMFFALFLYFKLVMVILIPWKVF